MSSMQRLQAICESKQQEWEVAHNRLASPRQARLIETDASNQFKLNHQIKVAEQELIAIQQELDNLESLLFQEKDNARKSTSSPYDNLTSKFIDEANVCIQFNGVWLLADAEIKVFLGNKYLGTGSLIKGFSFQSGTNLGESLIELQTRFTVLVKTKVYNIQLSTPGQYEFKLAYNRFWGNFDDNFTLRQK